MPESDFPHAMTPHKTAFVHKAIDAINASLGRVLPDDIVAVVEEFGFGVSVFGYHELIVINLVLKVFVIEIVLLSSDMLMVASPFAAVTTLFSANAAVRADLNEPGK